MAAAGTGTWTSRAEVDRPLATTTDLEPAERLRLKVFADAAGRDRLAAEGFDIAGYNLPEGWVEVLTDRAGSLRLRATGFELEILEIRDSPVPLGGDPEAPGTDVVLGDTLYTDPGELEAFLNQVVLDHPDIVRLEALGTSHEGRTIWGLMISDNAAADEDELAVLLSGAHHAREVMSVEVVMDVIEHLTANYGALPEVTAAVDAYHIWCVPMVNPDGVNAVFTYDQDWRKNTLDNDHSGTLTSLDGVDLNRNYEWGFGNQCQGSSGGYGTEVFRGPSEASEPEVQAMIALGRRIRPVFDVEYHSYGEAVWYATSCDPTFAPTLTTIQDGGPPTIGRVIGQDYASRITQADGGGTGFYAAPYGSRVDGTGRDQQYHENGAIAFVTEINSSSEGGFRPSYTTWREATVAGQRPGWLWLLDRIDGAAIGGHVRDSVTHLPLAADLALDEMALRDGQRLTSRADTGRFHLIVVPGDYTLRVTAPGYQDAGVSLTVGSSVSPLLVDLVPSGSSRIVREEFEVAGSVAGWTMGDPGDDATSGLWVWAEPQGTHGGTIQGANLEFGNARFDRTPGAGTHALVTGNQIAATLASDDVDGGTTTVTSPPFDLSGWYGVTLSWHRWLRKSPLDPPDGLETQVSASGGPWITVENLTSPTSTPDASSTWTPASARLDDLVAPGADVRLRFRASDTGVDHVVEAAIDDLEIRGYSLVTQGEIGGVMLGGAAATALQWNAVAGAPDAVFDVVRGDLDQLAGSVDLGPLTCIEDDSQDSSTSGDADTATPAPGEGFFYVVRFELGDSVGGYGAGSDGGTRTGTGGCAP